MFQKFDWPVARPVEDDEILTIEIYTRNRLFADKLIGFYRMVLQNVIKDGRVAISDSLLNSLNQPLPVSITNLSVAYCIIYGLALSSRE